MSQLQIRDPIFVLFQSISVDTGVSNRIQAKVSRGHYQFKSETITGKNQPSENYCMNRNWCVLNLSIFGMNIL